MSQSYHKTGNAEYYRIFTSNSIQTWLCRIVWGYLPVLNIYEFEDDSTEYHIEWLQYPDNLK